VQHKNLAMVGERPKPVQKSRQIVPLELCATDLSGLILPSLRRQQVSTHNCSPEKPKKKPGPLPAFFDVGLIFVKR
jgi:hypothetical protein